MIQQRLFICSFAALLALACSGGDGSAIEPTNPNALPPSSADEQPPSADEAPPITGELPPSADEQPRSPEPGSPGNPGAPNPPPTGGGGSCEAICARGEANGCGADPSCVPNCAMATMEPCGSEILALANCVIGEYCPSDFQNADDTTLEQFAQLCPSQLSAFVTCQSGQP